MSEQTKSDFDKHLKGLLNTPPPSKEKTMAKTEKKANEKPFITLNKLGEYLEANAGRRQQIVKGFKYPQGWDSRRYNEAKTAVIEFYTSGFNEKIVTDCILELETKYKEKIKKEELTEFDHSDITASITLLENVLDTDLSELTEYAFDKCNAANTKINIQGLDISVNPNLIVKAIIKGKEYFGTVKLHYSKTYQLSEESGKCIALVLRNYSEHVLGLHPVDNTICIFHDLPTKTIVSAPIASVRRMAQIEAACKEIVLWWNVL